MRGASRSGGKVAGTGGFGDNGRWEVQDLGQEYQEYQQTNPGGIREGQLQDLTGQPPKSRMRRLETTSEKKNTPT